MPKVPGCGLQDQPVDYLQVLRISWETEWNMINIIVACDDVLGIGKGGDLPWRIPGDLKRFKNLTQFSSDTPPFNLPTPLNHVIMGRVTWESLPSSSQPLSGRVNHVISSSPVPGGASRSSDLLSAIEKARKAGGDIYVIGGQRVYESAMSLEEEKRIFVTRVQGNYGCDRFFPALISQSTLRHKSEPQEASGHRYWFETHEA